jgi:hypothetical protein
METIDKVDEMIIELVMRFKMSRVGHVVAKICRKPARAGINLLDWLYLRKLSWLGALFLPLVAMLKLLSMPVYSMETQEDLDNFWKAHGWTQEE